MISIRPEALCAAGNESDEGVGVAATSRPPWPRSGGELAERVQFLERPGGQNAAGVGRSPASCEVLREQAKGRTGSTAVHLPIVPERSATMGRALAGVLEEVGELVDRAGACLTLVGETLSEFAAIVIALGLEGNEVD